MPFKKPKESTKASRSSSIDSVFGLEDLAFLIALYISPNRNSSLASLCVVSSSWNKAFSLVRAQFRYDDLQRQLSKGESVGWMYHKLIYIPASEASDTSDTQRFIPPEGCLRIFLSNIKKTCDAALTEYRTNQRRDENSSHTRRDSRPDYFFRTYRESPECIEFVPPFPLHWKQEIKLVNEVEWDDKPRLICKFLTIIDDVNGIRNPLTNEISKEGRMNLGYHECVSLKDGQYALCSSRPPLNETGEDTSAYLSSYKTTQSDTMRWIKFAHVIGEDRCQTFVKKHLIPMMGFRPTGNSWRDRR